MKKIFVSVLCVCICGLAGAKGWKPLFSADLSNADCDRKVWSIDNKGVISATEDQAIWSAVEYENFELKLEFKTDKCTNSGVLIYCTNKKDWIPNAVEIQIADDFCENFGQWNPNFMCGAVFGHLPPSATKVVKKPGEWNKMQVTAKGKNLRVVLNGKKIIDMDMSLWTSGSKNPDGSEIPSWLPKPFAELPTKGYIGFQGKHGQALIWFRNIKIKEL